MNEGRRVLLVSDDDDVSGPLTGILARAGYRVVPLDSREAGRELAGQELAGPPPDALILDRDLPAGRYQEIIRLLERHRGRASFPLLILGGGPSPALPDGWHEDAWRSIGRPPEPGEALATIAALLRLGFYRAYRDLVHDLAGPVTSIHALTRSIVKTPPTDQETRRTMDLLVKETDRLMSLLSEFQKKAAGSPGQSI
jgi:DNA-binding response OmpR family regulator